MGRLPEKIIDSHHHLWIPENRDLDLGYGWLRDIGSQKPFGDPTPIQRNYLFDEFRHEQQQVTLAGSVHLQCDPSLPDPVEETKFIQRISEEYCVDIAIVGFVDLGLETAQKTIDRHLQSQKFRGVRQIISRLDDRPDLSFAPRHLLRDDRWRAQYALLGEHSLSFDLQLYPEQMEEAADFLALHPQIPVIVDHAGSPYDQSDRGMAELERGLKALAELPHISIKLCGFGMFDKNWNGVSIAPIVSKILELFGAERILFGSNFPVDKLMNTYLHCLESVLAALSDLNHRERDAIFHDNAKRIYKL